MIVINFETTLVNEIPVPYSLFINIRKPLYHPTEMAKALFHLNALRRGSPSLSERPNTSQSKPSHALKTPRVVPMEVVSGLVKVALGVVSRGRISEAS